MSVCEYSPFDARMVRFGVNIVLRGANTVYTIGSLILVFLCFSLRPRRFRVINDAQGSFGGGDRQASTIP